MHWQYRTIVFEFQKDGLLGDRFIDDEEVEETLNEQGRDGWELVSATMVQEGLLTLFKQPGTAEQLEDTDERVEAVPVREPTADPLEMSTDGENFSAESLQRQEQEHIRHLEDQRKRAMREQEQCLVGDIKIS